MARPVTLFTGQWADLPLEELARKAGEWGFDGLELACWGDHFEVDRALAEDGYVRSVQEVLERNHLNCFAIGAHLVGQAVCDPIDERHQGILPPEVWGDGDPEGVRRRAAERMKDTARAAARLGVTQVNGFTGSAVWHMLYSFPPNDFAEVERGYAGLRRALGPDHRRVRRGGRALRARGAPDRDRLRLRDDAEDARRDRPPRRASGSTSTRATSRTSSSTRPPSSLEFADRIYHVHVKDSKKRLDGRKSILGGAPELRRARARLGLRLARATATSTSRS